MLTREEEAAWRERDPIRILADAMKRDRLLTDAVFARLSTAAEARIDEAVDVAESSPWPDVENAAAGVWAP